MDSMEKILNTFLPDRMPSGRQDQIFTPSHIAKEMVEALPDEVWNSKTTFLDPACKSGIFLHEIYKKLMATESVIADYPDKKERREHILNNQLYGIAMDDTCWMLSVRTVYGQLKPDSHIITIENYIAMIKNPDQRFLYEVLKKEFGTMKFDVVIGNPPYQENTGAGNNGARAIYNLFIDKFIEVADILSFIVPSRWMSDNPNGIGSNWLYTMRNRDDFISIVDYADSSACFDGVSIAGGVCHFVINKNYHGDAFIKYIDINNKISERVGNLGYKGVVIRNHKIRSIAEKIDVIPENSLYNIIGTNRQLSPTDDYFATNWTGFSAVKDSNNYIKYFANSRILFTDAYISEQDLPDGILWLVKKFKLFLPLTGPTNNQVVNIPFVGGENSCCSRTYAPMYGDAIDNEEKANNCIKYWRTKFLRLLVSGIKTTQHATRNVYKLVPLQDFTSNSDIDWSQSIADIDKQLYKKYNLTDEEIEYIEKTIKAM